MSESMPSSVAEWKKACEQLAEVAALIRRRALAADTDEARTPYSDDRIPPVHRSEWGRMVDNYLGGSVGEHCASWTPAAALAVADWLDVGANVYACVDRAPMLRVARAYLGTDTSPDAETRTEPAGGAR